MPILSAVKGISQTKENRSNKKIISTYGINPLRLKLQVSHSFYPEMLTILNITM